MDVRNIGPYGVDIPALGITIEAGQTAQEAAGDRELDAAVLASLLDQPDRFAPADDEASAAVNES